MSVTQGIKLLTKHVSEDLAGAMRSEYAKKYQ